MSEPKRPVRIWDLPVRLFHWCLVALLAFQFYSGKTGGNLMEYHMYVGYLILALVLFRVTWGFAGSTHARFSAFIAGPRKTLAFAGRLLSKGSAQVAGHNPLGGWMVIVMLVSLLVQAGTGLFANDDIATEGPLFALVSKELSDRLTTIHSWNFNLLLVLTGLHVAAVLFHVFVKRENLISAMFTGVRLFDGSPAVESGAARFVSSWRALVLFLLALVVVILIVKRPF
jgi:cytochrome b